MPGTGLLPCRFFVLLFLSPSYSPESYRDHTVRMMRVIPFVCYSVSNTDNSPGVQGGAIMGTGWEYQVRVEGRIGQRWLAWFDGLVIYATDEEMRDKKLEVLPSPR